MNVLHGGVYLQTSSHHKSGYKMKSKKKIFLKFCAHGKWGN